MSTILWRAISDWISELECTSRGLQAHLAKTLDVEPQQISRAKSNETSASNLDKHEIAKFILDIVLEGQSNSVHGSFPRAKIPVVLETKHLITSDLLNDIQKTLDGRISVAEVVRSWKRVEFAPPVAYLDSLTITPESFVVSMEIGIGKAIIQEAAGKTTVRFSVAKCNPRFDFVGGALEGAPSSWNAKTKNVNANPFGTSNAVQFLLTPKEPSQVIETARFTFSHVLRESGAVNSEPEVYPSLEISLNDIVVEKIEPPMDGRLKECLANQVFKHEIHGNFLETSFVGVLDDDA